MSSRQSRYYSIIPAAGTSSRMGCHKLLLPWPNSSVVAENGKLTNSKEYTVLDDVLASWANSLVDDVVLVLRNPANEDRMLRKEHQELVDICGKYRIQMVLANDPPDMKTSIVIGLEFLREKSNLTCNDRCFISPADLPGIRCRVIDQLIQRSRDETRILLPVFGGRKGHPVLFPVFELEKAKDLPENQGVKALINDGNSSRIEFQKEEYTADIDTPSEYEKRFAEFQDRITRQSEK